MRKIKSKFHENHFLTFIFIFGEWVFVLHLCLCTALWSTNRNQRGQWIPRYLNHRWLWASMWLIGIHPSFSARAASALNPWEISPVPLFLYNGSVLLTYLMISYSFPDTSSKNLFSKCRTSTWFTHCTKWPLKFKHLLDIYGLIKWKKTTISLIKKITF